MKLYVLSYICLTEGTQVIGVFDTKQAAKDKLIETYIDWEWDAGQYDNNAIFEKDVQNEKDNLIELLIDSDYIEFVNDDDNTTQMWEISTLTLNK